MSFLFQVINFVVLVGVIGFFAKKILDAHFKKERENLQKQMQVAAADYEKVQQEYDLMKEKLDRLSSDLETARRDAEASLKNEGEKIKADTDEFIAKLSKDLQIKLASESERTRQDFTEKLTHEAFRMAKESLSARLMKEDEAWTSQIVQTEVPQGKKNYASK